jgi:hypothetical protein
MVTQEIFIESCRSKYVWEMIPIDQVWHDAHYPTPDCKGGTKMTPLWESDHAAHNVIQSEEVGYPCVFGWEKIYLIDEYAYLLPLFNKWMRELRVIAGRNRGKKQSREVKQANGRKMNQKMLERMTPEEIFLRAQRGGQTGGKITGKIKVQCPCCGMVSTSGPIALHLRSSNNSCSGTPIRIN